MKIRDLKHLIEELNKEIPIIKENVTQELQNNTSRYHYWVTQLTEEKITLRELERKKKKLFRKLYDYYKYDIDKRLDTKEIITIYIEGDDKWQKLFAIIDHQKTLVEYLEFVVKAFSDRHFALGNLTKLILQENKFE